MSERIFDGLKVIDCASFIAGPAAATVMSDFGADVKERISARGAELVTSTPEELDRFNRAQIAQWAKVVKFAGAKPD